MAHVANAKEAADIMLSSKEAHLLGMLGCFDSLVGHNMIEHEGDSILIEYSVCVGLVEFIDGDRER